MTSGIPFGNDARINFRGQFDLMHYGRGQIPSANSAALNGPSRKA